MRKISVVLIFLGVFNYLLSAQEPAKNEKSKSLRLILPPAVYAVPGHEINIYFGNIILTINERNFVFDVDCAKGRQDEARWRYTPGDKDSGKYPWTVKVISKSNKVKAEGKTEINVAPVDAGAGKEISVLVVGDSLTDASAYPNELNNLFKASGNPSVKFIGSHAGAGNKPGENRVAHEGRGGWTWAAFCTKWDEKNTDYRAKSPFLFLKEGKPELDFQKYLEKYNDGKVPDFITVLLGCNDTFGAKDETIEQTIDKMFKYSDMLIAEFRKVAPDTQIGILLTVPPSVSQDAFGSNYQCGQTRWQYRRNQHRVVERMLEKYGNMEKDNIFLIPAYVNLDCVNGFPVISEPISSRCANKIIRASNSVHPAKEGYLQIADSIYYWMKYRLSIQK